MGSDPPHAATDGLSLERDTAIEAALAAGRALRDFYGRRETLTVEAKDRNDFVSNADREAEHIITAILSTSFPGDTILGEETGSTGARGADRVWCVDPLDGTTNFLKGAHNWCVSIGLWISGVPALGVIFDPLRDELFVGVVGHGASCNKLPIHVSGIAELATASVGMGHNHRLPVDQFGQDMARVLGAGSHFRQVGAGALMLAYVAAGRIDGYFERHMWPWDAVAGLALVTAAGGLHAPYPRPTGDIAPGDEVCAGNPRIFSELHQIMMA